MHMQLIKRLFLKIKSYDQYCRFLSLNSVPSIIPNRIFATHTYRLLT